jgi:hypothetical protein
VVDYPRFEYTKKQVLKAGEALKGRLTPSPELPEDQIHQIFRIAYSWRDSHAYPMQSIRQEVAAKVRACKIDGITVGRLKRMPSIRKKLRTISSKLNQLQDLGGCRAILPSMTQVYALVDRIKSTTKHRFHHESPYISDPKPGGYRSHHLVYEFAGAGATAIYDTRRIEIQVRTRLQHSWATAVEAIGLFRNEDLKGGIGDADWLRLFDLVSAEFALIEKCPESKHVPPRPERLTEIIDLEKKIGAVRILDTLRDGMRRVDPINRRQDKPSHYRIQYDHAAKQVTIIPHSKPIAGIEDNNAVEEADSIGRGQVTTVYVEADSIEALKAAYPNYFGDVQVFTTTLSNITTGKTTAEFTMPPRKSVPPPPKEPPDFTWMRAGARRRRWVEPARSVKSGKKPRR